MENLIIKKKFGFGQVFIKFGVGRIYIGNALPSFKRFITRIVADYYFLQCSKIKSEKSPRNSLAL